MFTILAAVAAMLMPLAAAAQVTAEPGSTPPPPPKLAPRYNVFVGYSYSSLNQVNQSRYGLQGIQVSFARNWGRYFALVALADHYKWATSKGNPGNPSETAILGGPQLHVSLGGPIVGFFRGEMGGEHTGGEDMTPNISFAGGFGGGLDYNVSRHLAFRACGDRIAGSFSLRNNTAPGQPLSPHRTWNTWATIGVMYKF